MPDPIDISLEVSIGAVETTVPIDITLDPVVENCGCDDACDIQGINPPSVTPPLGIPPTFTGPSAVGNITSPMFAVIENNFVYDIDYTQRDGGTVDEVRVYIDNELLHSGGLEGSFPVTLTPGVHTVEFEVDYLAGPDGVDNLGNIVANPIGAGTLTVNGTVTAQYPFYSGSVASTGDIPNSDPEFAQLSNLYLNTEAVNRIFWFAVKTGAVVMRVEDSHAMYLDLSGLFTFLKTITVEGIGYSVYTMTNAIPYSVNHKFEFDVSY